MKTKKQITNRILSLVLILVMVLGMVPLTAYAASEAATLPASISYKEQYDYYANLTVYYKHNNYLYKAVFSNIKNLSTTGLRYLSSDNQMLLDGASGAYLSSTPNVYTDVYISDLPTQPNQSVNLYVKYKSGYAQDETKPVVVTCMAVGDPAWTWNGTSSATAKFTSTDDQATMTVNAAITSSTQPAENCLEMGVVTYTATATATANGQTYTTTKTADGAVRPHSYTYSASGDTVTETCSDCYNHTATAKLTLVASETTYTGSAITVDASVSFSENWAGSREHSEITYSNNVNVGDAVVKVKVAGHELTTTFKIKAATMSGISAQDVTATYDGEAHGITVSGAPSGATITYSKSENGTYTATQPSIINVDDSGTIYYKVSATGHQVFYGSAKVTINPKNIDKCTVADIPDQTYNGSPIIPDATVTDGENTLVEGEDYTVSGSSFNVGTGSVTITGTGNYSGFVSKDFEIKAASIANAAIALTPESGTYTGEAYTPSITVTFGGAALVKDTDYTISWDKDGFTTPDTYTVRVVGAGNFTGYVDKTFKINAANIKDIKVEQVGTLTYDGGKALTPTVTASAVAVNNQPITFTYSTAEDGTYGDMPSFTEAGTYTVYFKAAAPNHNEATGSFTVTVNKAIVTEPTIASKVYNGSVQTADIADTDLYTVVENNGGTGVLENGKGYNVVLKLTDPENYKWSSTDEAEVTLSFKITRATNEWEQTPSIEGWTYGEIAKVPVGTAKFGDVSVEYSGTANDGTSYISTDAPTKAGSYKATFIVAETENYSGLETSVDFTIGKATYDMTGAKWDYDEAFDYDGNEQTVEVIGLPSGVSVSGYEGNKATVVGNYTAKVTFSYDSNNYNAPVLADLNWSIKNDWELTNEYTVSTPNGDGWLNNEFTITPADGYKISTTDTADSVWSDRLTYSAETDNGSVTFYLKNETDGTISLAKTVTYKLDKTDPTGRVELDERNGWETFLTTISFGLFYKDEVTVKVTANDDLSDVAKIEYASSDKAMTLNEVKEIANWTEYNGSFGVTKPDAEKFVYFIRITDNAGNVTYLSTDGAQYDTTAPVISGVENGKTYYTTQKVTVTDENIDTITFNGEQATENITLEGNKEATYTIVVTDKAGNNTTVTVTMKPIKELAKATENLGNDNVTSADAPALRELVETLDELIADPDTSDDGERETLEQHKAIAESLLKTIDDTKAEIDRINEELNKFDSDTVNSDDIAALEQLGKDIKALTDGNNLTNAERTALTEDADDVAAMQKTVADTTAENKCISDAVDGYDLATVTSDDKADLEQLVADINKQLQSTNLTEEEISELNGNKKAVEDLLAKIKGTDELIDKLTEDVDGYSEDTVKSTDKDAIEQIIEDIDALLETENLTDAEKKALEDAKAKAEGLLDTIEDAAEATTSENTEKVKDVTTENVTPEDKTDLEKAKEDLEKALEDHGSNMTEDEKKAVEDEIKRIDDALEVIGNVEEAEELIDKLPAVDTVEPDDEEAIKAITNAQTAYNALSDYEKSLVDEATKAALDKLAAAIVAYDIVEGDGSSWTEDSDHSITFVVNGLFSKFVGIKVDGKDVDKANYEAKAGSTIITLKASYLDALKVGEHTITVIYADGETEGTFNIHAKANSPATGDDFNIALYGSLMVVSVTALVVLLLISKKKKYAK